MPLPSAVEAQEARADALFAQTYGPKADTTQAPQGTPVAAQNANPTPAAAPAAPKLPDAPEETWEKRFNVLNGKYNAEVPRYAQDKRELQMQVSDLTGKLAIAMQRIETLEAAKQAPQQTLVTPEEVQEFGEPLVDLIRRVGREEFARAAPVPASEISELRGRVDSVEATTAKTAEQTFFTRLGEIVPDWVTVNEDPAFHAWLAQTDDLTGEERQTLLANAQRSLDAGRVARFFTNYRGTVQTRAANAQQALEAQVIPDSTRQSQAPRGKAVFSRADVARFYSDWRGGRISDAEAIAKEAEIQLALNEGRVR